MKIEKLTENKIRIIVNSEDLTRNNADLHSIMTKALETQGLLLEMLSRAEKEVGFNTDGYKLLIEAFSSSDDIFIFTITKYKENEAKKPDVLDIPKKKLLVRKKCANIENENVIYRFKSFDQFCDFCCSLNNINNLYIKNISKNISLYLYNNTYYLTISNINTNCENIKKLYFTLSEFGELVTHSKNFENKLLEHGKIIMRKNAISTCIKYFSKSID